MNKAKQDTKAEAIARKMLKPLLAVAVGFFALIIIASCTASKTNTIEPVAPIATTDSTTATSEPEAPKYTVSQKNSIKKAQSYLDYTAFSRTGLIKQLKYEGFSTEDATFAVDNITVDWMVQAEKMAENYMSYSSFSRSSLINQLQFEGFTVDQAEHGATFVGL